MKRTTLLTLALACGAVLAAPKADLAKGKQIAQTVCAACHAADGNSGISSYPKLSAQHATYIIKETVAIKDGKRTTGGAAARRPMVGSLSAQDIADVAAFYATQTPKPACHGPSGTGMPGSGTDVSAYPRLGGQHKDYTMTQLKAYASGQRKSPNNMMEDVVKRMSEEEMNAVANFIQGLH